MFHFIVATLAWLSATPVVADMTVMTDNTLFCPSWAEAHERSLAILNNGRPPYRSSAGPIGRKPPGPLVGWAFFGRGACRRADARNDVRHLIGQPMLATVAAPTLQPCRTRWQ